MTYLESKTRFMAATLRQTLRGNTSPGAPMLEKWMAWVAKNFAFAESPPCHVNTADVMKRAITVRGK